MIAGGYLWLTHSDGIVSAWDTRYGVQSFSTTYDNSSSPSQSMNTSGGGVMSGVMNCRVSGTISNARSCSDSTSLVQISAVLVSDNGPTTTTNIKDTSTTTTATTTVATMAPTSSSNSNATTNHRQYHYYLTTAVSVEGTTRATSVIHGPLSLPPGDPPCPFLAF